MKQRLQLTKVLAILLLLFGPALHAQWQNGLWIEKQAYNLVDSGVMVDYNSGAPILNFGYPLYVLEGSATISDAAGQLLFFAGSNTIWNRDKQVMLNGDNLISGDQSSTQFGVFVQKPGDPSIYYLFNVSTTPSTSTPNAGLVYSEIDLTLDGGLGGVTANKNIILDANVGVEKITSVYHADGQRVWIISHRLGSNEFVAYLVSAAGISTTPVISALGNLYPGPDPANESLPNYWGGAGQMKVSPDGSKLAASILDGPNKGVDLFDFNNETGAITNAKHISGFNGWPYGIEFSPNSKFLYACNPDGAYSNGGSIGQYDATLTTAEAVMASKEIVVQITSPWAGNGGLVLSPLGRIYSKDVGGEATNVINNPNNFGAAAGFQAGALPMSYGIAMPTFNQTYFASGILAKEVCPLTVDFTLLRIPDATSVDWNFGDPASGAANISNVASHIFSSAGTYTVNAVITSNGATQNASVQVTVTSGSTITLANLSKCSESDATLVPEFDFSGQTAAILAASPIPADVSVTYYTTPEAAASGTGNITATTAFPSTGQTIYVRISNAVTGCFSVVSFQLIVAPIPVAAAAGNLETCDTGVLDGFASFNLTPQTAAIQNGQTGTAVTYFRSQPEADANSNAITTIADFISTSNPQTIIARISNTSMDSCYDTTSFELRVTAPNLLDSGLKIVSCSPIDLNAVATDISGTPTLSFYTTNADAIANTNAIANPAAYTFEGASGTVYVRAEDASGCADVAAVAIVKDSCEIQKGISANGDGLNDVFDLDGYNVTSLAIFNRYGTKVYSKTNYTNEWGGQSDKGDELPDATYYYVIERANVPATTGWIYVSRKN